MPPTTRRAPTRSSSTAPTATSTRCGSSSTCTRATSAAAPSPARSATRASPTRSRSTSACPACRSRAKDGEGPGYELGYRLHFEFGLSKSKGFFVDTNGAANDETEPELALGLNFTLPAPPDDTITAQLGFITVTAQNCLDSHGGLHRAPATAAPLFDGVFSIDLKNPDDPDGLLTAADLSDASFDSLFDVKLSAGLHLNWLLKARPGDDVGFPGVQAQFIMDWSWSNDDPNDGATLPTVEFTNVAIDAGAVFGEVLGTDRQRDQEGHIPARPGDQDALRADPRALGPQPPRRR